MPYAIENSTYKPEGNVINPWIEYGSTDRGGFSDVLTLWSDPLFYSVSGTFYGYLSAVGGAGHYWASDMTTDDHASVVAVGKMATTAANSMDKYSDFSVRCLLR